MRGKYQQFLVVSASLLLTACSTTLHPQAQTVKVSTHLAPQGCEFRGAVSTDQGDYYTCVVTPVSTLKKNALTDLRNQAASLGANYVALTPSATSSTTFLGTGSGLSYHMQGTAYFCPKLQQDTPPR